MDFSEQGEFPDDQDYINEMGDTSLCFAQDDPLFGSVPEERNGLIGTWPGGNSVVFKLHTSRPGHALREVWALKCFTAPDPHRGARYGALMSGLPGMGENWTVDVAYRDRGFLLDGRWWPTARMPWVGGSPLNDWLERNAASGDKVERCRQDFARVALGMERAGVAHGDLQPANILVETGDRIKLIDYDSMYLPGTGGLDMRETGVASFQLPGWERKSAFGPWMDRFPVRLIHLSLLAIAVDHRFWERLHVPGDNFLLLHASDLADPEGSERFRALLDCGHPLVRRETEALLTDLRRVDPARTEPLAAEFDRPVPAGPYRTVIPYVPEETARVRPQQSPPSSAQGSRPVQAGSGTVRVRRESPLRHLLVPLFFVLVTAVVAAVLLVR